MKEKMNLTLNVNGMNLPVKQRKVTKGMKKHTPVICSIQETSKNIIQSLKKGLE